jgi:hypothetical protein
MSAIAHASVPSATHAEAAPGARLQVEYWTVTMDQQSSCGSCDETLTELSSVVDSVRPLAGRLGIAVEVVPRTVATWLEAVDHGIVASPTIRAAGIEVRPSHPDGSETRVWEWRGTTTGSPTPDALFDFLVRAVAVRSEQVSDYLASGGPAPYVRHYLQAAPSFHVPSAADAPASATGSCGRPTCN